MAEFGQTMRQWKRMCDYCAKTYSEKAYPCTMCPASSFSCRAVYKMDADKDWDKIAVYKMDADTDWDKMADVIEKWANEHPEPQYPTWGEFLQMTYHNRNYAAIFITPIPADIAEKLGLKPKGAANNAGH